MQPTPGDRVRVERDGVTNEGVLMPSTDDSVFVVKLDGGYNVGIDREPATVELIESGAAAVGSDADAGAGAGEADSESGGAGGDGPSGGSAGADDDGASGESAEAGDNRGGDESAETGGEAVTAVDFDEELPTISLVSTGGTIASTIDYQTGAVTARFEAEDVLRAVPDLAGRANYRCRVVANILSENMEPPIWQELAEAVAEEIEQGADGVVVMHGTDTMQYSASALSFMLDTPVPIVFTGSQRSADRPSSDNVVNAVCAVEAAKSDCSEVLVAMHADGSDDGCALHRGTRVRKNHTARRDAFETVGNQPLGYADHGEEVTISFRREPSPREPDGTVSCAPALAADVELVKFVPGMTPDFLSAVEGADGLIVEGTGLGHVHTDRIPKLASLVEAGTTVVMTSQCLEGRVCDRVYDTGRALLDAGVVEAEDTLPGTALVKLMWVLANRDDPAAAMRSNLAGEITHHSQPWT